MLYGNKEIVCKKKCLHYFILHICRLLVLLLKSNTSKMHVEIVKNQKVTDIIVTRTDMSVKINFVHRFDVNIIIISYSINVPFHIVSQKN